LVLAEQLKKETLFHHQQLEKLIVGKIKGMTSIEAYISLLQHFYAFFGGIEDAIPLAMITPFLDDYPQRRKTENLRHDILCCGGTLVKKTSKNDLPVIDDVVQALGALYVIEGSTLGGQIISKMISQKLNFTDEECLLYFKGYNTQTEIMWMRFKELINRVEAKDAQRLIHTANETFIKFNDWIKKNEREQELQQ